MDHTVRITQPALDAMMAAVRGEPNLECCGLLAGRDGVISVVLPARNALASATAYEMSAEELFSLFRRMRAEVLEHLGIYHSHPRGENAPSTHDVEQAFYPEAVYFILSPGEEAVRPARAFRIVAGKSSELAIELV